MLHDIRKIKEQIETAKKKQVAQSQLADEQKKKKIYNAINSKITELEYKKIEKARSQAKMSKLFLFAKFAGIAAIFVVFAFSLTGSLKSRNNIDNIIITNLELKASDYDVASAKKYVNELLDCLSSEGISAIKRYLSQNADEEAQCFSEEIFGNIKTSDIEIDSVKLTSSGRIRVKCSRNGDLFYLTLVKKNDQIFIESIN